MYERSTGDRRNRRNSARVRADPGLAGVSARKDTSGVNRVDGHRVRRMTPKSRGRTGTGTETEGTVGTVGTEGGMIGVLVAARIIDVNGELSSAALREGADADCCTTGMEDGAMFVLILLALALAVGGRGASQRIAWGPRAPRLT